MHNFHDVHQFFPPEFDYNVITSMYTSSPPFYLFGRTIPGLPTDYGSWVVLILPFIEQNNLAQQWPQSFLQTPNAFQLLFNGPNAVAAHEIKILECPSYARASWIYQQPASSSYPNGQYMAITSYVVNFGTVPAALQQPPGPAGADGMFGWNMSVRITDVTDGTSNTLLVGERDARDTCNPNFAANGFPDGQTGITGAWFGEGSDPEATAIVPLNYQSPPDCSTATGDALFAYWVLRLTAFGSAHDGGANFCLADGSVRFIATGIPLQTLQYLATKAGGEVIPGNY